MKPITVLTFLSLISSSPVILANELSEFDKDTLVYCEQQATSAGIEDATEKNQYIQECAAIFGVTVSEANVTE